MENVRIVLFMAALILWSAIGAGVFFSVAYSVASGNVFPHVVAALILLALAWVAGKIENRNNKDSV